MKYQFAVIVKVPGSPRMSWVPCEAVVDYHGTPEEIYINGVNADELGLYDFLEQHLMDECAQDIQSQIQDAADSMRDSLNDIALDRAERSRDMAREL